MRTPPTEFGRSQLISLIEQTDRTLEIGPFTRPLVRGPNVRYFDVLDKDGLIERARQIDAGHDDAVDIDFVCASGDLSIIDEQFDICLASHSIEHQPDLIAHLDHVYRILADGGRYFLVIPDKRYCFDHFLPETTIADVVDAQGRTSHTLANVMRHRFLVTHNEPLRHWRGDHGFPRGNSQLLFATNALSEFEGAAGGYLDVHAWQFTPASFRLLIDTLKELGLTQFTCERLYPAAYGIVEFCAILRKSN